MKQWKIYSMSIHVVINLMKNQSLQRMVFPRVTWKRSKVRFLSSSSAPQLDTTKQSYGGLGGIGADIFDRLCETMFTRVVMGLQINKTTPPGKLCVQMPLYDFELSRNNNRIPQVFNKAIIGDSNSVHVHNGVIAALIDHCGGICSWTKLTKPSQLVATIDLQIDYCRPIPMEFWTAVSPSGTNDKYSCGDSRFKNNGCETIYCETSVVHLDEKFILTDVNVYESEEKKIKYASGRGLYNIYTSPLARIKFPFFSRFDWFNRSVNVETIALSLPSNLTAFVVRWIERSIVWRLRQFPAKYDKKLMKLMRSKKESELMQESSPSAKLVIDKEMRYNIASTIRDINGKVSKHKNHHENISEEYRQMISQTISLLRAHVNSNTFIREVFDLRVSNVAVSIDPLSVQQLSICDEEGPVNGSSRVVTVLPFKTRFIGNFLIPCVHGGVTAALLEYTGYLSAVALVDKWMISKQHSISSSSTMQSFKLQTEINRVSYLQPTPCEHLVCIAEVCSFSPQKGTVFVNMAVYNASCSTKLSIGSAIYRVELSPN